MNLSRPSVRPFSTTNELFWADFGGKISYDLETPWFLIYQKKTSPRTIVNTTVLNVPGLISAHAFLFFIYQFIF